MSDSDFINRPRSPSEQFEVGEISKRINQFVIDNQKVKHDMDRIAEKVRKLSSNEDKSYFASRIKKIVDEYGSNIQKIDWYSI